MQSLTTNHYQQLLGLPTPWKVSEVKLSLTGMQIEIRLDYEGKDVCCPVCNNSSSIYDQAPEQRWRHLDTMQFETILIASVPRCNCKKCGVKTVTVPWANKHSRFTLLFEGFTIELLQHCSSIKAASRLLRLSWHATNEIMKRAVNRGLSRRNTDAIEHIGIDEKSFRAGHQYITILNDLNGGRVLDVVETRTTTATVRLLNCLQKTQRMKIKSVALDMWKPFKRAVNKKLPKADIVHDRFHISKYLNEAVDTVRRHESSLLNKAGDSTLIGSRFVWLRNPENMTKKQRISLNQLMACELKTGVAWSLKNMFRVFWQLTNRDSAEFFFNYWVSAVEKSELNPLIKVKDMLLRHKDNIFNYFKHRTTNAVSEGLNSKIQLYKAAARGFRSFLSYRTRILFYCGKLDLTIGG